MAAPDFPFEKLDSSHVWYSEADDTVQITRSLKEIPNRVLTDDARLTIALNQICFERGRGRVFLVQSYPDQPAYKDKDTSQFEPYNSLKALPALVYIHSSITDAQAAEWKSLTPCQQLHRSWAPHGWLHPDVAVLPLSASLKIKGTTKTDRLKLHGRFKSPLLVAICDSIFVGTLQDWVGKLQHHTQQTKDGHVWRERFESTIGMTELASLKVEKLTDVLDFLETKYRDDPTLLCTYRMLEEQIEKGFVKWATRARQ